MEFWKTVEGEAIQYMGRMIYVRPFSHNSFLYCDTNHGPKEVFDRLLCDASYRLPVKLLVPRVIDILSLSQSDRPFGISVEDCKFHLRFECEGDAMKYRLLA